MRLFALVLTLACFGCASIEDAPPVGLVGRLAARGLDDELSGSGFAVIDGIDGRSHHVVFRELADTSDAPIGLGDNLRRRLLAVRRSRSNLDRLRLVGGLPATLGVEIPTNGEPRTGLSMGEHAAVTAKQMHIARRDQDALAAASHCR